MTSTKKAAAPEGSFALLHVDATGACAHCNGLTTLHVVTSEGPIGAVVADWTWDMTIPDDPTQHPASPHYAVEWFAQDLNGTDIPGIRAAAPYFIARAIHERWQTQNQRTG